MLGFLFCCSKAFNQDEEKAVLRDLLSGFSVIICRQSMWITTCITMQPMWIVEPTTMHWNQCVSQCYNAISCGIKSQVLSTLLDDSMKLCQLHLMRASVLLNIKQRVPSRTWAIALVIPILCTLTQEKDLVRCDKYLYFKVSQTRILVSVCTRLGSDVISISIMGGTLSRGVCLSKPLLNITSPSRRNEEKKPAM